MIKLSQRDPKWRYKKIGQSNLTIGNYGCLITDISMFSDWYGKYRDPAWMSKNLQFTQGGLLIWKSIDSSKLPMKFVYRYYTKNDAKIREILASRDGVCLLQVNSNHWVALVGYSRLYGYRVADPFYGDVIYLNKRGYRITGFAELTRK